MRRMHSIAGLILIFVIVVTSIGLAASPQGASAGGDSDGDGLSDEMEAQLGTCSTLSGWVAGPDGVEFDCSLAADPRDTDGDGISDGLEVLGAPGLALPDWGADPRHKDLFIEVDFMQRQPGETPQRLPAAIAREFAAYYQDEMDDAGELVQYYRGITLGNPDRKPGINVHLDTGRAPETPEDETLYGDWGGYTVVPPVNDGNGNFSGADYRTAWMSNMAQARWGIFRYILAYDTGGGQVRENSYSAAGPMDNGWVLAHEFGHAMGFGHSGKTNITYPVDPNCKPNHPTLMNYAFTNSVDPDDPQDRVAGFSDGLNRAGLNNVALKEWEAVSPTNTLYLDDLEAKFKYWVDREHGHVDWNRDGVIAPDGQSVRAYANLRPGYSCEYTRYNQALIPKAASTLSPAMARTGDRLYVFYSVLGALYYTSSTDAGNCPVPDLTPCATWEDTLPVYMDAQQGVDAVRMGDGKHAQILIVTIDGNGDLWERRLSVDIDGRETWFDAVKISGASQATGEPALARNGCEIHLAYRGADGIVRTKIRGCSGGWSPERQAQDQSGSPITMAEYSSPGLVRAHLDWKPNQAGIYGVFPDAAGRLDLYWYSALTLRWEKTDLLETRPGPVAGRPALEWVAYDPGNPADGRLYLMFVDHDDNPDRSFRQKKRIVRMMVSYVKVEPSDTGELIKTEKVGLYSPFDNTSYYAFGIDLLFEPGVDSNLRSVQSLGSPKPENWAALQFRPKADGINDFTYVNYNDWDVMRVTLYQNLVNPTGTMPDPIACPTS